MAHKIIKITDPAVTGKLFGSFDKNAARIENAFSVRMFNKQASDGGDGILIEGDDRAVRDAGQVVSYLRKIAASLKDALDEHGLGNVLMHRRSAYAIDITLVDCDYWDYLDGAEDGFYFGEFMNQYSWAEKYIYQLEQIREKKQ